MKEQVTRDGSVFTQEKENRYDIESTEKKTKTDGCFELQREKTIVIFLLNKEVFCPVLCLPSLSIIHYILAFCK